MPDFYFTEELKPIKTPVARSVAFTCEVSDEKAEVTWYKAGKSLTRADVTKFDIQSAGRRRSLTVHDVTPKEAGEYKCELKTHQTAAVLEVLEEG